MLLILCLLRLSRLAGLLFRLGFGIGFFAVSGSRTSVGAPDVRGVFGVPLTAAFLVMLADGCGCRGLRLFRSAGEGGFQISDEIGEMIEHGNKVRAGKRPVRRTSRCG